MVSKYFEDGNFDFRSLKNTYKKYKTNISWSNSQAKNHLQLGKQKLYKATQNKKGPRIQSFDNQLIDPDCGWEICGSGGHGLWVSPDQTILRSNTALGRFIVITKFKEFFNWVSFCLGIFIITMQVLYLLSEKVK